MRVYQSFLTHEFKSRLRKNRRYSLRAFARDLGLSPGFLSQVLAGKKGLSPEKASVIAGKLGCTPAERTQFLNLVRLDHAKCDQYKAVIRRELQGKVAPKIRYREIEQDAFQVVANWYYHALVAMTEIKGFQPDASWISKRLGLADEDVERALKALAKLKWIDRDECGNWRTTGEMMRLESVPNRAVREHHRQFLELAVRALETQDFEERDFSGCTLAINARRIPEARRLIKEFRENMAELLTEPDHNTHVYRLSIQLFRVQR